MEFKVIVNKVTGFEFARSACSMTFQGKSHISPNSLYKSEHSPARTQLFWIEFYNIPLFISTHLLRHHVGSVPFQLTCRDDRDGGNPGLPKLVESIKEDIVDGNFKEVDLKLDHIVNKCDRYTPVNLGLFVNAQSLIDMSKLRLCNMSHKETILVFKALKDEVAKVDPDLAKLMVRKCVYRGGICGEMKCCGFNNSNQFKDELKSYLAVFNEQQRGSLNILFKQ